MMSIISMVLYKCNCADNSESREIFDYLFIIIYIKVNLYELLNNIINKNYEIITIFKFQ